MKYYIFGNKKSSFRTNTKRALFVTEDLQFGVDTFKDFINEVRDDHLYLIADLGNSKRSLLPSSLEESTDYVPFFVIGEWHFNEDTKEEFIRTDHIVIKKSGFALEFSDNLLAMREFENCVNKEMEARFILTYSQAVKRDNIKVEKIFKKEISSTATVNSSSSKIGNIKLSPLRWKFIPVKEKELNLYTIKRREEEIVGCCDGGNINDMMVIN